MGLEAAAISYGEIIGFFIFMFALLPFILLFFGVLQFFFIFKKVSVLKQFIAVPIYCLIGQGIKLYFTESLAFHFIDYLTLNISVAAIVLLPITRWLFKPSWSKDNQSDIRIN
jgi:hypothetical protein